MNQKKTGEFFKTLRKEKGLTQEQLAEKLCVNNRTVSRWETGHNMPDLDILIEMADFYEVDIRELIDGERKSENMDKEMQDTLIKVAEYSNDEKTGLMKKLHFFSWVGVLSFLTGIILNETGLAPDLASFCSGFAFGMLIIGVIYTSCYINKFSAFKKRIIKRKH